MHYKAILTHDHDQKVKLGQEEILCYSAKQLKKLYPNGGYHVAGETRAGNKKEAVADFMAGQTTFKVSKEGTFNHVTNRCAGYVKVGEDQYLALYKSRLPFLLALIALIALLAFLLSVLIAGPDVPVVTPDHPLPEVDQNAVAIDPESPLEDEHKEQPAGKDEEGGGAVSMIYTLEADVSIASGDIAMYFKNPTASTHDVVLEMYIVSEGEEYLAARSGRIEAGYELGKMELMAEKVILSEGNYNGLYKVHCYDPVTGELALVAPEITDLDVTVRQ